MDYTVFLTENLPIGSGVTEAACKSLVKQLLCASAMRWKTKGAKIVLNLRADQHGRTLDAVLAEDRSIRGGVLRLTTLLAGRTRRGGPRVTVDHGRCSGAMAGGWYQ
jgi:hypothetical protein